MTHGVTASPRAALQSIETENWSLAIIHAHFAFDAVYARRIARRLRLPLAVTLHGIDVAASNATLLCSGKLAWWRLLLERHQLGEDASIFLCVSDHVRRLASRHFPPHKLRTAFLGVDTGFFQPAPLAASPSILFVGRLVEKKGARYLLEALQRVRASLPGATLTMVGAGPLEVELLGLIDTLGLKTAVTHIRRAPQSEIRELLNSHRVFCLPSVTAASGDTEGLPISLLEAMACAKPIVSTRHAGIPEAIAHEQSGLLSDERDVDTLAANLLRALNDDPLASRIALAARQRAETTFDIAACAAHTESLYTETLQGFSNR